MSPRRLAEEAEVVFVPFSEKLVSAAVDQRNHISIEVLGCIRLSHG